MKNLGFLTLFVFILLTGTVSTTFGQRRQDKTSAGRAAYGHPPPPSQHKSRKKHKANKQKAHQKHRAFRKKYNWAA